MSRAARIAALGLGSALALIGCGSDSKKTQTTTVRTTATASPQTGAAGSTTTTTTANPTAGTPASQAAQSTSDAALIALRPFSSSSPWNTAIDTSALDPRSARYLTLVKQRIGTVENASRMVSQSVTTLPGSLFINTYKWAPPIVDVRGGRATRLVCRQLPANCGDAVTVTSLDVPTDISPLPQYDGWFTVTDRGRGVAYDFWRARRSRDGGTISYQFSRRWDLNGPGFLKPTVVSARGSGLPLFAGVIVPEEIRAGQIDHALAIALPGPARRDYVQPASRTDGDGSLGSLPEGARIRLRAGFQMRRVPGGANGRAASAIVTALKRYGAIVVDRSRVPTLFAQQNFNWSAPADGSAPSVSPVAATGATSPGASIASTTTTTTTPATTDATTTAGTSTDATATTPTTTDTTTSTTATLAPDAASPTGLSLTGNPVLNAPSLLAPRRNVRHPIPLLQGNELQGLSISDFEVVQLPGVLQDPPPDVIQVNDLTTR